MKKLCYLLTAALVLLSGCMSDSQSEKGQVYTKMLYAKEATALVGDVPIVSGNRAEMRHSSGIVWDTELELADKYDVYLIANINTSDPKINLTLKLDDKSYCCELANSQGPFKRSEHNVERKLIVSDLPLNKEGNRIELQMSQGEDSDDVVWFRALELIPHSSKEALEAEEQRAIASRADLSWMKQAKYGLMFHWTSQSVNPDGENLPYHQAVNEFDVDRFAQMVEQTGAGYVFFTVDHAEQYCPAPIESWERIHPGQTTRRDLIMELADALAEKDVKLMCYMNSMLTADLYEVPKEEFYANFREIVKEFGARYGEKLAGYWFDCWYQIYEQYPEVPFEDFYNAAKTGYSDRVLCLNSWVYPAVSPWQDFWAGEVRDFIDLPTNGTYTEGPAVGLPHQSLLIMEPYWVQSKAQMAAPRMSSEDLAQYINDCSDNGGLVTINMGIYQNGQVGEDALKVMAGVKEILR